jgi:23S rRNA pseudouridine1911/1915/1917 synthase
MKLTPNPNIEIELIYENEELLAIDKPAGTTVHPAREDQEDTLVNGLISNWPEIKNIGDDPLRPGIVHRLDRETSGIMLIAKTEKAFNHLKEQFAERKIEKKYLALVNGVVKNNRGTVARSINISKKDRNKRTPFLDDKSKSAWTKYEVIERYKNYTLLEVMPKTGRTHQIRVHLSSEGYPVSGDKQYKFKRQKNPKGLNRQFLHACYLKFSLTNGKIMELKSELPTNLKEVLDNLETQNSKN